MSDETKTESHTEDFEKSGKVVFESQDQLDSLIQSRLAKEKRKYKDYDSVKSELEELRQKEKKLFHYFWKAGHCLFYLFHIVYMGVFMQLLPVGPQAIQAAFFAGRADFRGEFSDVVHDDEFVRFLPEGHQLVFQAVAKKIGLFPRASGQIRAFFPADLGRLFRRPGSVVF